MIEVKYFDKKRNMLPNSNNAYYAEVYTLDDKTNELVTIDYYHVDKPEKGLLSV